MPRYQPPLPPTIVSGFPSDPFEAWLARQAAMGHDRDWLRRNANVLKERAERGEDLPLPLPAPGKPYDRYNEL